MSARTWPLGQQAFTVSHTLTCQSSVHECETYTQAAGRESGAAKRQRGGAPGHAGAAPRLQPLPQGVPAAAAAPAYDDDGNGRSEGGEAPWCCKWLIPNVAMVNSI